MPRTPDSVRAAIDVRFALHNVWSVLRDLEGSRRVLAEATDLARASGDRPRLRQSLVHLSSLAIRGAEHHGALDAALEAQGLSGAGDDFAVRVRATYEMASALCALGHVRRARDLVDGNVRELAARPGERFGTLSSLYVSSCTWFAIAAAELGDFAAARACGQRALATAETLDDPTRG